MCRPSSFIAALLLAACDVLQAQAMGTWTIPGVVKAPGRNGTNYVSDVVVTNPGTVPAVVLFGFVPPLPGSAPPQFLGPGQTLVVTDAVGILFGAAQAVGALQVTSDQTVILRARTYNTAPTGTFGVSLPVVPDDRFLEAGDSGDSLWASQSADSTRGYRTNVAVVFPDANGGTATVTLFDAGGSQIGQKVLSSATAGFQQVSVDSFASPFDVGRARIDVTSGRAAGYAVVVDNVTGDGSVFSFAPAPAGPQDVVVNGVTRAGGQLGTFWRTDARLFNPSSQDATVSVSWLPSGSSNVSPTKASVAVQAGKLVDLPDVLSAVFGLPSGSSGALRFQTDQPVAVLCRTSNLDPTGARAGTFGAQQASVPVLSFLTSADAGALITAVRQGGAFRTNVGFAAGPDGATWQLTLKDAAGTAIASGSGSLGPFGWTQPGVSSLFPNVTIPDGSQVAVRVTAGSLDVYDSSIDNGSGDPVVTSAAPLPAAIPSTATIGPEGGSVQSDDGRFTLKVPAGALAAPTSFQIAATTDAAPNATGSAYAITPGDVVLAKPALVVFSYGPDDVSGSDPQDLLPASLSAGQWYSTPTWDVDTARRTVTAPLASLAFAPASARGGVAALRAGGPVIYQLVQQLVLSGPSIIQPGTSAPYTLSLLRTLRPGQGATILAADETLAGATYHWRINLVTTSSPTLGSLTPQDPNPSAVYLAPTCPPPEGAVNLTVVVSRSGKPDVGTYKTVTIFPLLWTMKFEETVDISCSVGPVARTAAYAVHDVAEQDFSIDSRTGLIREQELRLVQPNLTKPLTGCGIYNVCTITALDAPSGLSISTLTGRVRRSLRWQMTYYHIGAPPTRVQCPNAPAVDRGGTAGAKDYSFSPYGIGWRGTDYEIDTSSPGIAYSYLWSIRPRNIDTSQCP